MTFLFIENLFIVQYPKEKKSKEYENIRMLLQCCLNTKRIQQILYATGNIKSDTLNFTLFFTVASKC